MVMRLDYDILSVSDTLSMQDKELVKYDLEYLYFKVQTMAFTLLNQHSLKDVKNRQAYVMNTLYGNAVQAYLLGSQALPYEYSSKITVSMNENNIFSAYQDDYVFSGGAHGNTIRSSFTYNTETGATLSLCDFMSETDCRTCVSNHIIQQIKNSGKEKEYFDNYPQLVLESFKNTHFYVSPQGLVVYFEQYEIGPYVLGIQTFIIPYNAC